MVADKRRWSVAAVADRMHQAAAGVRGAVADRRRRAAAAV